MIPQPTELPEWATIDVQDPISGQYNVVTPPTEVKLEGWRIGEKPNRQWWNWFNRTVYDWINYFNANLDFSADTITPVWTGLTNQPNPNYFYYKKIGDMVYFTCHIIWAGNIVGAIPLTMTNLPFIAKNSPGLLQSIHVSRGVGATNADPVYADGKIISALINAGSTSLEIWYEKPADGLGGGLLASDVGQLIISGFYFIEPV